MNKYIIGLIIYLVLGCISFVVIFWSDIKRRGIWKFAKIISYSQVFRIILLGPLCLVIIVLGNLVVYFGNK